MSITSTSRIKSRLGIPAGVTFHDVAIGLAVDYANDVVLRAIGQTTLAAQTYTDYPEVYSPNQIDVQLDHVPVVSIISITNSGLTVQASEYRLDANRGKLRMLQGQIGSRRLMNTWSDIPDDVVVTYLAGFTSSTIHGELVGAADLIAADSFQKIKDSGKDRVRNSSFGYDVSKFDIPPAAQRVLNRYEDKHHN